MIKYWVDFTQVCRFHTDCVCTCSGFFLHAGWFDLTSAPSIWTDMNINENKIKYISSAMFCYIIWYNMIWYYIIYLYNIYIYTYQLNKIQIRLNYAHQSRRNRLSGPNYLAILILVRSGSVLRSNEFHGGLDDLRPILDRCILDLGGHIWRSNPQLLLCFASGTIQQCLVPKSEPNELFFLILAVSPDYCGSW